MERFALVQIAVVEHALKKVPAKYCIWAECGNDVIASTVVVDVGDNVKNAELAIKNYCVSQKYSLMLTKF